METTQESLLVKMALMAWDTQNGYLTKLINDLSDEQLQKEIAPGKNTGVYLLGHLIAVSDGLLPLLGFGDRLYPEMEAMFLRTRDKSGLTFPSIEELKKRLQNVNAELNKHFQSTDADGWFSRHMSVSSKKFANKKSKEDFFKWIVKQQPEDENKIFYRTIDLSWGNFWIFRDWNILTKKDSSDIQRQIVLSNGALFPDNMSIKRVIVTNEKEDFYLKFSNPIFFDNNKKVWIHYQLWSNGKLGFESFQVYERNRGKYKILQDGSVLNSGDVE